MPAISMLNTPLQTSTEIVLCLLTLQGPTSRTTLLNTLRSFNLKATPARLINNADLIGILAALKKAGWVESDGVKY